MPVYPAHSGPKFAIRWVAILASDDKNANPGPVLPINYGIGKVLEYVNSPYFVHRCAEVWKLNQQVHYSVELVKKPTRKLCATFLPIETRCFEEIKFCASM